MSNERKMATIRQIKELTSIAGADLIETATVDGWKVVVNKGNYQVGDLCIYCEIDSWIPHSIAPSLVREGATPRVYNNVEGQKLRTVKLRGQISQGLILPLSLYGLDKVYQVGQDVSDVLGIQKWELPMNTFRSGAGQLCVIPFPDFIPKTSQDRVQNIPNIMELLQQHIWEVTEKLHGQSMTVYYKDGKIGVCSRNIELSEFIKKKVYKEYTTVVHKWVDKVVSLFKDTPEYIYTREPLWEAADRAGVIEALKQGGINIAIQGELVGKGIQSQAYGYDTPKFFVFDIFDINDQKYFKPGFRRGWCNYNSIQHIPHVFLPILDVPSLDMLLSLAEGKSSLDNSQREGLVIKSYQDPSVSFKVVSNKWLLEESK